MLRVFVFVQELDHLLLRVYQNCFQPWLNGKLYYTHAHCINFLVNLLFHIIKNDQWSSVILWAIKLLLDLNNLSVRHPWHTHTHYTHILHTHYTHTTHTRYTHTHTYTHTTHTHTPGLEPICKTRSLNLLVEVIPKLWSFVAGVLSVFNWLLLWSKSSYTLLYLALIQILFKL